jgi:hypothetical protein
MSLCEVDGSLIQDLLKNPFSRRTLMEKLKIIEDGDHAHLYPSLRVYIMTKMTLTLRIFGFCSINKLFWWPCFLFSKSDNAWSLGGFDNLNLILHRKTQIFCITSAGHTYLLHFGHQRTDEIFNNQLKFNKSKHNIKVCKAKKFGMINQCVLPGGKSGTTF